MTGFIIFIHVVSCLLLMIVILMQSGRGGGLTEAFASAESMFGAKTNEFMVRTTVVLASIFLVTSLSLARLSAKRESSLLDTAVAQKAAEKTKLPAAGPKEPSPGTQAAPISAPAPLTNAAP